MMLFWFHYSFLPLQAFTRSSHSLSQYPIFMFTYNLSSSLQIHIEVMSLLFLWFRLNGCNELYSIFAQLFCKDHVKCSPRSWDTCKYPRAKSHAPLSKKKFCGIFYLFIYFFFFDSGAWLLAHPVYYNWEQPWRRRPINNYSYTKYKYFKYS